MSHGAEEPGVPALGAPDAVLLCADLHGLDVVAAALPSYRDRNFRVRDRATGATFVLKIAHADEDLLDLDLQHRALAWLAAAGLDAVVPRVVPTQRGEETVVRELGGVPHAIRLVSWLEGELLARVPAPPPALLEDIGRFLGRLDRAFAGFTHPRLTRPFRWNLGQADWTIGAVDSVLGAARRRALVQAHQLQFLARVPVGRLPRGPIHHDANDHNVLVRGDGADARVAGLIDFGDMVETCRVFELAVAVAYAILGRDDPLATAAAVVRGYAAEIELTDDELEALLPAVAMRLCVSVTVSAQEAARTPDNDYIRVSEAPAWEALAWLATLDPDAARDRLREAAGRPGLAPTATMTTSDILASRRAHVGPSLSLHYGERALQIVRGRGQHLFDERGRAYLDCVNNVCHVGHSHPRVVEAAARQMRLLNTNTRYLHENLVRYAERLCGLLPASLSVCYFVNSGSEANELALRLARTFTGARDVVVVEGGYHGHTSTLIELSPYKFSGPGGAGPAPWVHVTRSPDPYRGAYRGRGPETGARYAADVAEAVARAQATGRGLAAFLAEPLIGCGGQVVPPAGWLSGAYAAVRAAGGVCIADEVQLGFGRVGPDLWAFRGQDVVPDILTLGKPIGNGHPLAAVITTPEIAQAFHNGMEFFSTFGGNPVSCAVGLAVLDVLEDEDLPAHAARVGALLQDGFRDLARRHDVIGDVRGVGLFLGVELVEDRATLAPGGERLARVVAALRATGILLSTEGPHESVLKLKPPLPFSEHDARLLLAAFDRALEGDLEDHPAGFER